MLMLFNISTKKIYVYIYILLENWEVLLLCAQGKVNWQRRKIDKYANVCVCVMLIWDNKCLIMNL